jgi:hypothetical protein
VVVGLWGCYNPTVASDVPCSSELTCPSGQLCDTSHAPPLCVTSLDYGATHDASPADVAMFDAPTDAFVPIDAAGPPITFLQSATVKPTAAMTTLGFNAGITAHDAIIVCLNYPAASGATLTSITDSLGNTYLPLVGPIDAAGERHYIAAAYDSPAGGDTLTVTLSAAPVNGSDLMVMDYSGLALSSAFDASANATGTGTSMNSGGATTTFAHELVVGYAEAPNAMPGTGFTQRAVQSGNLAEDLVVSTKGTYHATATTTTGAWEMIVATFKGQ